MPLVWPRTRTPTGQFAPESLSERFWAKVDRTDECWIWLGSKRRDYGLTFDQGRHRPATQVAWELTYSEPFPTGMDACHTCDNPPCVRPDHIFPGTAKDNIQDAKRKGRLSRGRTHCPAGHRYDEANTYYPPSGRSGWCRACQRAAQKRYKARKRAAQI
jgi:hypothetical protein